MNNEKKTGIELIAIERNEQLAKHGRTVLDDNLTNQEYQLAIAAAKLLAYPADVKDHAVPPKGWNVDVYKKMHSKPYAQRLIIAGALIAAEIDRLQFNEEK